MPELDSEPPQRSDIATANGDRKIPSRGKYGFILAGVIAVVAVALLTVVIQQNRELADLRRRTEHDLRMRDQHLRSVYGFMLSEQGGAHHEPSDTYRFEGGVRVAAGDRWCVLDANDDFDPQQLYNQLAFIAPLAFPGPAYHTHTGDHVEWVMTLFKNDLEQLKDAAKSSPDGYVKRTFSGDVERHAIFEQAIVTTVVIRGSGARPRFTVRIELSPEWKKQRGL